MKVLNSIILPATLASGVMSIGLDLLSNSNDTNVDIPLARSVINSAAYVTFKDAPMIVAKVGNKLVNKVGNKLVDKVGNKLVDKVGNKVGNKVDNKVDNKVGGNLVNNLGNSLGANLDKLGEQLGARQIEPDPNRPQITPSVIFGFTGNCTSLGAPPGSCVSYFDFQNDGSTAISDLYNNNVSSLSTNHGGKCQYYNYLGCNSKGDDRGLTASYLYDLSVALPDDDRIPEYENNITSWRC